MNEYELKDKNLKNLLYADDVVLLAGNEDDLRQWPIDREIMSRSWTSTLGVNISNKNIRMPQGNNLEKLTCQLKTKQIHI